MKFISLSFSVTNNFADSVYFKSIIHGICTECGVEQPSLYIDGKQCDPLTTAPIEKKVEAKNE
jgi:hypothetical protein